MEMFNKKELDNRIGHLKKDKKLYDLEQVEGYVIRKASELGLEYSYDVMAEDCLLYTSPSPRDRG